MFGLMLVGALTHYNVKGSILIGILSVTLFSWYVAHHYLPSLYLHLITASSSTWV